MNHFWSITSERLHGIRKWAIYTVILLFLYCMQSSPFMLRISDIKPLFLVPFAVCAAMREGEFKGAIFGMFAGLLWDTSGMRMFGYYGVMALIVCMFAGLLIKHLLKNTLYMALLITAVSLSLILTLDYYLYFAMWGTPNTGFVFTRQFIPVILYSLLFTPLHYLVTKLLSGGHDT